MSPAYDLTPAPVISKDSRFLAMTCGYQGRISHRENLISGHARFLLIKEEAESIVYEMAESIKKNWYNCLRRTGASEKDCEIVANAFVYEGFFYSSKSI